MDGGDGDGDGNAKPPKPTHARSPASSRRENFVQFCGAGRGGGGKSGGWGRSRGPRGQGPKGPGPKGSRKTIWHSAGSVMTCVHGGEARGGEGAGASPVCVQRYVCTGVHTHTRTHAHAWATYTALVTQGTALVTQRALHARAAALTPCLPAPAPHPSLSSLKHTPACSTLSPIIATHARTTAFAHAQPRAHGRRHAAPCN